MEEVQSITITEQWNERRRWAYAQVKWGLNTTKLSNRVAVHVCQRPDNSPSSFTVKPADRYRCLCATRVWCTSWGSAQLGHRGINQASDQQLKHGWVIGTSGKGSKKSAKGFRKNQTRLWAGTGIARVLLNFFFFEGLLKNLHYGDWAKIPRSDVKESSPINGFLAPLDNLKHCNFTSK